jgi:T4 RnlA family RNA ligase
VHECRGLILDAEYNIVSRSFNRFYNYGEQFATFDPHTDVAYEKFDGSLIKIYHYNNEWRVSTRGTAFAESGVNGWDITFKDMVLKALTLRDEDDFQAHCNTLLDESRTYIFEVTGVQNRVVTRYEDESLWFLASRNNETGKYYSHEFANIVHLFKAKLPRQFKFDSIEHCLETAKHLPDLQEGYVIYSNGAPVCKVKSPAYVAVHHIRQNLESPKNFAKLVLLGEDEEYLTYFPENTEYLLSLKDKWNSLVGTLNDIYKETFEISLQKDFALKVKDHRHCWALFEARKSKLPVSEVLQLVDIDRKVEMLLQ